MNVYDYIRYSENFVDSNNYDINWTVNYPFTSPRIVKQVEVVSRSPYLNSETNTWWQFDDIQNKYIDTGVKAGIDTDELIDILNTLLPTYNVSMFNNDAGYTDEEESTIWEKLPEPQ